MMALIAIARDESDLDSIEVNTFQSRAVVALTDTVQHLYAAGARGGEMETLGGPAKRRSGLAGSARDLRLILLGIIRPNGLPR